MYNRKKQQKESEEMTIETVKTAITGNEDIGTLGQALDALVQFYRAFNSGDFDLMAANWLQTEEAAMSNPLGDIKRGWEEISSVYRNIFNGPAKVYVEYWDYRIFERDGFFQAVGRERGYFQIASKRINLAIRTSRTYVRTDKGYKQLHHHGSIDQPDLLAVYQHGVRSGEIQ